MPGDIHNTRPIDGTLSQTHAQGARAILQLDDGQLEFVRLIRQQAFAQLAMGERVELSRDSLPADATGSRPGNSSLTE
ncbi:hypothetical protein Q427_00185 [Halomonas sp. BC04]|nr:hypothetical protein Q427_00185 [Halomonas sp. BC04]